MDRETPRGGGQDATVVAVIAAIVFLGTFVAYYYLAYKPKIEEIAQLEQQKAAKISELQAHLDVIKEQKNYEVRLAVLQDQWDVNKHWFVNGTTDWSDRKDVAQTQFAIFSLYQRVVDIARGSGIDVDNRGYDIPFQVKIDEQIKFYLDDDPYDFPREYYFLLENLEFEPSTRFPEAAEGDIAAVTTEGKQLFNSHNFTIAFTGSYDDLSLFAKNLQQRFGSEDTLIAVHCYATDGEKLVNPGRFGSLTTTVQIGYQMYVTAYSIFDAPNIAINTPPNLPTETDCKASGGGGGSRGGSSGGGGGGGGGGVSMGVG